ncbi:MAG TPA: hypothetical protein VGC58_01595, partial [Candidatus Paceibacterota bacterium]
MTLKQYSVLLSRISLFIIYFWFGLLKLIGLSPATGLVQELFDKTIAHVPLINMLSPGAFVILFGIFEVIIGILFIIPGKEKWAINLFFIHIAATTGPIFFLKESVLSKILVPTLEGQYIIKNLALF